MVIYLKMPGDLELESKCRACLQEQQNMLSMFDVYEHDLTLAMILQSCVATEVRQDDGLPPMLCDSCILILTQFYNFSIIYEQSNRQLQSLLKERQKAILYEEPVFTDDNIYDESIIVEVPTKDEGLLDDFVNECEIATECDVASLKVVYDSNNKKVKSPARIDAGELQTVEKTSVFSSKELQIKDEPLQVFVVNHAEEETYNEELVFSEVEPDLIEEDCIVTEDNLQYFYDDEQATHLQEEDKELPEEIYSDSMKQIIKYDCNLCGEAHMFQSSFQQHMRSKHSLNDIDCAQYATVIYIKTEINRNRPRNHINTEMDEYIKLAPKFMCRICQKRFSFSYLLSQHLATHKQHKKYICEVCGVSFIKKTYLNDHKEGHSTERKYICKFCGKAFKRRTVLRSHKRVHTHPNYYVCELCGRGFTNNSTLKTHKMLIHTKERNFMCVICNQKFPLKATLNKHLRRHQTRNKVEKDFPCPQCDMEYRDKSSLKRHVETKHEGVVKLMACPDCPKQYTSKTNLMKHRRRHHNGPV